MTNPILHPGLYIKDQYIPSDMSIAALAKLLNVARPNLSNLLNGKSELSEDMILKLSKGLKIEEGHLFEYKVKWEKQSARQKKDQILVKTYAPSFLGITAIKIEAWFDGNIKARSELAVLLRILVNSTSPKLAKVSFPGNDLSQTPGWDGKVNSESVTPWVPIGKSRWEFGCNKNFKAKANKDFKARTDKTSKKKQSKTHFIFVTPHIWADKDEWANSKSLSANWKTVTVIDASVLEEWLESSVAGQAWLGERIGIPQSMNVETLTHFFINWAGATSPILSPSLFKSAIESTGAQSLLNKLKRREPVYVSADTVAEGLAFLNAFGLQNTDFAKFSDSALIFNSPDHLTRLSSMNPDLTIVVPTEETASKIGFEHQNNPIIYVQSKRAHEKDADIVLRPLSRHFLKEALVEMGVSDEDDITRLFNECGGSPSILRRRMANNATLKTPHWASTPELYRPLIPIVLAGSWDETSKGDREILSLIGQDMSVNDIEQAVSNLLQIDDSPVWKIKNFRGVISKLDTLFAVSEFITRQDIEHFLLAAEYVLSEIDPSLDIPVEHRKWTAELYGKTRNHSNAIRKGVSEMLILFGIHGDYLFSNNTGLNVSAEVGALVRRLLSQCDDTKLLSQADDMVTYAEAAPESFLGAIEESIKSDPAAFSKLMETSGDIFGGTCYRAGLLWALEALAWSPDYFHRVVLLLAELSQTHVEDNWSNTAENTIISLFRSWMPQTGADLEQRIKSLVHLSKDYPDTAWSICMDQLPIQSRVGTYNHKPKWRGYSSGYGRPISGINDYKFRKASFTIATGWKKMSTVKLADLISHVTAIPLNEQPKLWIVLDTWLKNDPSDNEILIIREKIRSSVLSSRALRGRILPETFNQFNELYKKLTPSSLVKNYAWLFKRHWVDDIASSFGEDLDPRKQMERTKVLRLEAIDAVYSSLGNEGIIELVSESESPGIIGSLLNEVLSDRQKKEFITHFFNDSDFVSDMSKSSIKIEIVASTLNSIKPALWDVVTSSLMAIDNSIALKVLMLSPLNQLTWQKVNQTPEIRESYWLNVAIGHGRQSTESLNFLVDGLLEFNRPIAAFNSIRFNFEHVETSRLLRCLKSILSKTDRGNDGKISPSDISDAIEELYTRSGMSKTEYASLEYSFVRALKDSSGYIPYLSFAISESPNLFAELICKVFYRKDKVDDFEKFLKLGENATDAANHASAILDSLSIVPGQKKIDEPAIHPPSLENWIISVQKICKANDRGTIADDQIGTLLGKILNFQNDEILTGPVLDVLERVGTKEMLSGIVVALYNKSSEARWRGNNPRTSRADFHQQQSKIISKDYPFFGMVHSELSRMFKADEEYWNDDSEVRMRLG